MLRTTMTATAIALWGATMCLAGGGHDESLTIGDRAPAIDIAHWLKGEKVSEYESGKVYVLEFWATWCAPCRASIPHLSELQKKYRDYDVTFIGVSDEKLPTVVGFLCKADKQRKLWNDKIQYTLATDPDRSVANAYMKPAAQDGIPTAFIIGKDARIEWIGSPMEIDDVLDAVVRESWDRDTFGIEFEREAAPARRAMKLIDKIDAASEKGQWGAAIGDLDELLESQPGYARLKTRLFRKMLNQRGDTAQTYAYGRTIMRGHWDEASTLNQLAWFTVDDEGVKSRDFEFAMEAALRASELTGAEDAGILDTVARVYYERGDLTSAITWQRKALEQAADTASEDQIHEMLEKYEKEAQER
ncbi:MAG: redoxin domain-containing protein [Planctomycetota bacterium]|nr:redoxin domain-containing protein [Planctomycetota bacterium]